MLCFGEFIERSRARWNTDISLRRKDEGQGKAPDPRGGSKTSKRRETEQQTKKGNRRRLNEEGKESEGQMMKRVGF